VARRSSTTAPRTGATSTDDNYRFGIATEFNGGGGIQLGSGAAVPDVNLWREGANHLRTDAVFQAGTGAWDAGHLRLGDYRLWVDSTGDLRIKNGAPTGDTDGSVVGGQS
jgi:hypothetical protein